MSKQQFSLSISDQTLLFFLIALLDGISIPSNYFKFVHVAKSQNILIQNILSFILKRLFVLRLMFESSPIAFCHFNVD